MYMRVLIVPLWNWNNVIPDNAAVNSSFNRTFMELKSTNVYRIDGSTVCFNRTFMELKFANGVDVNQTVPF